MSREPSEAGRPWLESALGELAEADAAEQAPPRAERALRAAFRATAASATSGEHGRPRRSPWAWWVAGAAAGLAMASALGVRASRGTPAPQAEVMDERAFLWLVEGEPLAGLDAVQLVRVRLPSTALARFGGSPDSSGLGSVDAEVLLGQDGVARAIRIVE